MRKLPVYQRAIKAAITALVQHHFVYGDRDEHDNLRNDQYFVFSNSDALQDHFVREYLVRIHLLRDLGRLDRHFKDQAMLHYIRSGEIETPTYVWNRHILELDTRRADLLNRGIDWRDLPPIIKHRSYTRQLELTDMPTEIKPDFRLDE